MPIGTSDGQTPGVSQSGAADQHVQSVGPARVECSTRQIATPTQHPLRGRTHANVLRMASNGERATGYSDGPVNSLGLVIGADVAFHVSRYTTPAGVKQVLRFAPGTAPETSPFMLAGFASCRRLRVRRQGRRRSTRRQHVAAGRTAGVAGCAQRPLAEPVFGTPHRRLGLLASGTLPT